MFVILQEGRACLPNICFCGTYYASKYFFVVFCCTVPLYFFKESFFFFLTVSLVWNFSLQFNDEEEKKQQGNTVMADVFDYFKSIFFSQLQTSKVSWFYKSEFKKAIIVGNGASLTFCILVLNRDFLSCSCTAYILSFSFIFAQDSLAGSLKF